MSRLNFGRPLPTAPFSERHRDEIWAASRSNVSDEIRQ